MQGNFCSAKCFGKWASETRVGDLNPFKGKRHNARSKKAIGLRSIDRKAWLNLFTDEALARRRKAMRKPEYRAKMARLAAIHNSKIILPTKAELKLYAILDKYFPSEWEYTGDGKVIIDNMIPDFFNKNGRKAVIELFGDYWHSQIKATTWRKTELGRMMAFNSLGIKCLVIWEHELKDEQAVVAKVKQFMKRSPNETQSLAMDA